MRALVGSNNYAPSDFSLLGRNGADPWTTLGTWVNENLSLEENNWSDWFTVTNSTVFDDYAIQYDAGPIQIALSEILFIESQIMVGDIQGIFMGHIIKADQDYVITQINGSVVTVDRTVSGNIGDTNPCYGIYGAEHFIKTTEVVTAFDTRDPADCDELQNFSTRSLFQDITISGIASHLQTKFATAGSHPILLWKPDE